MKKKKSILFICAGLIWLFALCFFLTKAEIRVNDPIGGTSDLTGFYKSREPIDIHPNSADFSVDLLLGKIRIYSFTSDGLTERRIGEDAGAADNTLTLYCDYDREFPDLDDLPVPEIEPVLEHYDKDGYILFFGGTAYSNRLLGEDYPRALAMMRKWGFSLDFQEYGDEGRFAGIVDSGKVASEALDERGVEASRQVGTDTYTIEAHGGYISMKKNGENYDTVDERGIYMFVFDKEEGFLKECGFFGYENGVMTRATLHMRSNNTVTVDHAFYERAAALFSVYRMIIAIAFSFMLAMIILLIFGIRRAGRMQTDEKTIRIFVRMIPVLMLLLASFELPVLYGYLENGFAGTSVTQILYHMTTNLEGVNWEDFLPLIKQVIKQGALAGLIGLIILAAGYFAEKSGKRKAACLFRFGCAVLCIIGICRVAVTFDRNFRFCDYLASNRQQTQLYEEKYADPQMTKITFPDKKKNLVYIFLESMEVTGCEKESGGGFDYNSMPHLSDLAKTMNCFNGNSSQINGAFTPGNTTWTAAGMVAQTAGIPFNTPSAANEYGAEEFLPGACTIGDILEKEGYHNCLLLGSNAAFANRDTYFKSHGNYEICDYLWAIDEKKIPEDYYVWWGYEDKKLFEYAKEKLTELSSSGEPFNLTLLTVDTHFTGGYICDLCEDTFEQTYANVIACSDRLVSEFTEWILEQDFGKDTVIVLAGDHQCMDAAYYSVLPEDYQRKTYVNFLGAAKEKPEKERIYSTMDLFPTTLSAMGCEIEGNRLGLGTDLYSETPTLLEEMGYSNLAYKMKLKSGFYNDKILLTGK